MGELPVFQVVYLIQLAKQSLFPVLVIFQRCQCSFRFVFRPN